MGRYDAIFSASFSFFNIGTISPIFHKLDIMNFSRICLLCIIILYLLGYFVKIWCFSKAKTGFAHCRSSVWNCAGTYYCCPCYMHYLKERNFRVDLFSRVNFFYISRGFIFANWIFANFS